MDLVFMRWRLQGVLHLVVPCFKDITVDECHLPSRKHFTMFKIYGIRCSYPCGRCSANPSATTVTDATSLPGEVSKLLRRICPRGNLHHLLSTEPIQHSLAG